MAPDGAFIHVLDDATLDILLGELDTIIDFTAYLNKKEDFIRSSRLVFAGGEEDLLAYYLKTMNAAGQQDFSKPNGASFREGEHITFEHGLYADLRHPQYIAKEQADKISYLWDNLINAFIQTVMDGTSLVPEGQSTEVSYHRAPDCPRQHLRGAGADRDGEHAIVRGGAGAHARVD